MKVPLLHGSSALHTGSEGCLCGDPGLQQLEGMVGAVEITRLPAPTLPFIC